MEFPYAIAMKFIGPSRTSIFLAVMALMAGAIVGTGAADPVEASPRGRVFLLARRVSPENGKPLSPNELISFGKDVGQLGYDDVLQAVELLQPPQGEIGMARSIIAGEPLVVHIDPWKDPSKILAHRLLELAPRHTYNWIQTGEMGWRGAWTFMEEFGKAMPDLAWDEIKRYYAFWWKHSHGGERGPPYHDASTTFRAMEQLSDKPGRRLILDGSYTNEPFADPLQIDAQMGMLDAAGSETALTDFLNWRLRAGKGLVDKVTKHHFSVDVSVKRITAIGLALLAKENPKRAISWAQQNSTLHDFDWHYQIYAGWVEFWPTSKEGVEAYLTRRTDAIEWLAEELNPASSAIHNAFFSWRIDHLMAAEEWLNAPGRSKKVEAAKWALRQKDWPTRQLTE